MQPMRCRPSFWSTLKAAASASMLLSKGRQAAISARIDPVGESGLARKGPDTVLKVLGNRVIAI